MLNLRHEGHLQSHEGHPKSHCFCALADIWKVPREVTYDLNPFKSGDEAKKFQGRWLFNSGGAGDILANRHTGVTSMATVLRDPKDGPVVIAALGFSDATDVRKIRENVTGLLVEGIWVSS